eukprot:COSAG06_NODE_23797_length_681_cov_0.982818_2_plen_63_part_01
MIAAVPRGCDTSVDVGDSDDGSDAAIVVEDSAAAGAGARDGAKATAGATARAGADAGVGAVSR